MPTGVYTRSEEYRKKMSDSKKGTVPPNRKGKQHTEETKKRMSKPRTEEHRKNISRGHIKHFSDRKTPLNKSIRELIQYSNWRTQVFGRDNFTCQKCGKRGSWLEAHHIKRFSTIMEENNIKTLEEAYMCKELWNLDNGVTLCRKCHRKIKIIKINKGDLK